MAMSLLTRVSLLGAGCLTLFAGVDTSWVIAVRGGLPLAPGGKLLVLAAAVSWSVFAWSAMRDAVIREVRAGRVSGLMRLFGIDYVRDQIPDSYSVDTGSDNVLRPDFNSHTRHPIDPRHQREA